MRIGSLFTGYGGLDMAVTATLGGSVAWHADNDPAASTLLAHHWPDVPNFGDITALDWTSVESVDVVTAGWPCQPWSVAGQRKGTDDERALWPEVARALRVLRPRYVVLENVPGIITAGELARVANTLATLGYRFAWTCLAASAIGAPHRRERVFIVAVADTRGEARTLGTGLRPHESQDIRRGRSHHDPVALTAHPEGARRQGPRPESQGCRPQRSGVSAADANGEPLGHQPISQPQRGHPPVAGCHRTPAAHPTHSRETDKPPMGTTTPQRRGSIRSEPGTSDRDRPRRPPARVRQLGGSPRSVDLGGYEPAIQRWENILERPAPAPTHTGQRGGQQLAPAFVEFLMGLPQGHVCDIPGLSRRNQLRLLGNGVVPLQAATAVHWLLHTLDTHPTGAQP